MGEHMGEREVVDGMEVVEVVEEGWEEGGGGGDLFGSQLFSLSY